MRRPAVGDHLAVAPDLVVEAKAGPAQLRDPRMDAQAVVEARRKPVAHVRLEHDRLEAGGLQCRVTAGELLEVGDARDLEPDEVVRVVRHTLRVGLGEADAHVGAEADLAQGRHSTTVEALATLLRERQPCVVLTGAGISTESGIPDFRSPSGIWAEYDPMEYATIDAFRRDPQKVWEFYALRLEVLTRAEPNDGHLALAELERGGLVQAVITQNIDGLHQRAGSRKVIEVHGSIRTASCLECGEQQPLDRAMPLCPRCRSVMKPDVVMFGELLPANAMEEAVELARGAGLLLVVGSTLEVYPVAGLPDETLTAGGALAIVNRGSTPFDYLAAVKVDAGAGTTLRALVDGSSK
jgi:NAD-dependent protein deacetylase/lipoamidase